MRYRTLAEPLEAQAQCTPDVVALVGDDGTLTYRELNEGANQLARALRENGVKRGDFVGICIERSMSAVIAILGVAKAGAAYVPLDPELPVGRMGRILAHTSPVLVLVHPATKTGLPEGGWRIVSVDDPTLCLESLPTTDIPCHTSSSQPAIVLSTSGSAGQPKMVVLPVDQALAFPLWLMNAFPLGVGDAILHKSPYGFDASTYELFWALYSGATSVVVAPGAQADNGLLVDVIERHRVTAVFFIPSMLRAFLEHKHLERCHALRWVFCGGEVLTARLRDTFHGRLSASLINHYGPTEAGAVSYHEINRDDTSSTVPIGRATAGYRLYVLDNSLNPLPVGQIGELYIGGDVELAHGYHNFPERTAERFLPDPFGLAGARMYRSGDLARATPDGVLEFLGRIDHEVKVRGQRVDCEEIAALIAAFPGVQEVVVVTRDCDAGELRLVAYVQAEQGVTEDILRMGLAATLPAAMIPAAFVFVDRWPISVNGKLDRMQLPDPFGPSGPVAIAGASELELVLADIWASITGRSPRSIHEDFFSSGGDSLRAMRLMSRLSGLTGLPLELRDFMASRTLSALATLLERKASTTYNAPQYKQE
jgi:amino acid adenylation domain-containing protein